MLKSMITKEIIAKNTIRCFAFTVLSFFILCFLPMIPNLIPAHFYFNIILPQHQPVFLFSNFYFLCRFLLPFLFLLFARLHRSVKNRLSLCGIHPAIIDCLCDPPEGLFHFTGKSFRTLVRQGLSCKAKKNSLLFEKQMGILFVCFLKIVGILF